MQGFFFFARDMNVRMRRGAVCMRAFVHTYIRQRLANREARHVERDVCNRDAIEMHLYCRRPEASSVGGLKLLVYEA